MAENKDEQAGKGAKGAAEGVTTRDDALDLGVPMLAGESSEPTGPEDALGDGPKRGDYSDRVGPAGYNPHTVVVNEDRKEGEPAFRIEAQRPKAEDRGEVPGRKGGVNSAR